MTSTVVFMSSALLTANRQTIALTLCLVRHRRNRSTKSRELLNPITGNPRKTFVIGCNPRIRSGNERVLSRSSQSCELFCPWPVELLVLLHDTLRTKVPATHKTGVNNEGPDEVRLRPLQWWRRRPKI